MDNGATKPTQNKSNKSQFIQFNLFSLYETYTNNNNKTQYKNKYLEQTKHILRYIITPCKVQESEKLEEDR